MTSWNQNALTFQIQVQDSTLKRVPTANTEFKTIIHYFIISDRKDQITFLSFYLKKQRTNQPLVLLKSYNEITKANIQDMYSHHTHRRRE